MEVKSGKIALEKNSYYFEDGKILQFLEESEKGGKMERRRTD